MVFNFDIGGVVHDISDLGSASFEVRVTGSGISEISFFRGIIGVDNEVDVN